MRGLTTEGLRPVRFQEARGKNVEENAADVLGSSVVTEQVLAHCNAQFWEVTLSMALHL